MKLWEFWIELEKRPGEWLHLYTMADGDADPNGVLSDLHLHELGRLYGNTGYGDILEFGYSIHDIYATAGFSERGKRWPRKE